jgi:hypothetical protein
MFRFLLIYLIFHLPLADVSGQTFSGQVYVMTEHFAAGKCQPQIECDCCSSDILFLSDKEFVMIDRCIYNDCYYRGAYTVSKGYLTLTFNQFVVCEIYDDISEKTEIKKQNLNIDPARFYITNCDDTVTLQRTDLKVLTKAFKDSKEKAGMKINELKKTTAWEQLR